MSKKMQAEIKESLKQEVTKRIRAKLKEQVFAALVSSVRVDVPRALIGSEIDRLMQLTQTKHAAAWHGFN